MFFSFSPTEILDVFSRVLLHVFRLNFSFCANNGLEKKETISPESYSNSHKQDLILSRIIRSVQQNYDISDMS